ncbi:MAG: ATP-binding cassette domain-containing protein [Melioribacteraceae bacterium]|jgi:phospholipid/cholesterol/gamma-HCH transport system ATP-binding protein|nr:ATP-binding cassette domain-containing protein [Melioribacteraceae bacterium]
MALNSVIEVNNLSKRFGSLTVLDDICLKVEPAENLIVFGKSGTGKSVLLKCIIGLMKPDSGSIYIEGQNVVGMDAGKINSIRKNIGFLFQSAALYDSMTVRENLYFALTRNKPEFDKNLIDEKIINTLELVSLREAFEKMPSELSGGMRKRIGLARAIITDPKIMLYDEPTTGLDPITSKEISDLILSLQKKLQMTSIVVTHDLICAKIIADRAIFLRDSKIAFEGTIDELTDSKDPFLLNFFSNEIIRG